MAPLKWTCKSLENIREELVKNGYKVCTTTIGKILREQLEYSLQGLKKTKEGSCHEDRNAQFEYLNRKCREFQDRGQPWFRQLDLAPFDHLNWPHPAESSSELIFL